MSCDRLWRRRRHNSLSFERARMVKVLWVVRTWGYPYLMTLVVLDLRPTDLIVIYVRVELVSKEGTDVQDLDPK